MHRHSCHFTNFPTKPIMADNAPNVIVHLSVDGPRRIQPFQPDRQIHFEWLDGRTASASLFEINGDDEHHTSDIYEHIAEISGVDVGNFSLWDVDSGFQIIRWTRELGICYVFLAEEVSRILVIND